MQEGKLVATLRHLCEAGVQFILVGGVAAVLQGAPIQTFDIDVVYSRDPENIHRLQAVLNSLDAIFRIQPERRLRPNETHLAAGGHLNLLTRFGPVDVLGSIGQQLAFEDLLPLSNQMDIGPGLRVRVLNLDVLIAIKEHLASDKDLAVLPVLRQTLRQIKP